MFAPGTDPRLRTLRFPSPAGEWLLNLWAPAADLLEHVASLWSTDARTAAFRERVIPRENVELMINFGGPQYLLSHEGPERRRTFHRGWVSGLQLSCLDIESPTAPQLISASLRPASAELVLGVCGRELAGRVIPLDEILGRAGEELCSVLEECRSAAARFMVFEEFLRRRLARHVREPHPAVRRAVHCLIESEGRMPIGEIAGELGCSRRYIETRTLESTGLSPKLLARLIRFSRAIDRVRSQAFVDWTEVAHSCGYYDQAHFIRDFRRFTGVTPTIFIAARDPSSQALMIDD